MASTFDGTFQSAAARHLLSQFGEQVVYTPGGGEASTLTAIVSRGATEDVSGQRGRRTRKTWELTVPTTAGAAAGTATENYVADPFQSATVTIDDEEFHVARVLATGPLAVLEISNASARDVTMPHMRK
jgi:hypothetical protein